MRYMLNIYSDESRWATATPEDIAQTMAAERGFELVEEIDGLEGYHLYHSARADLLRRLGRRGDARAAYEQALAVCGNAVDRSFLERRLSELADR